MTRIKRYCGHNLRNSVSPLKVNLHVTKYCHVWGICVTNNNGFWLGWLDLLALLLQLQLIVLASNQWVSKTRPIPHWTTSVFSSTVTDLVLIYESLTSSASVVRWLTLHSWTLNSLTNDECRTTAHSRMRLRLSLILRPTVSRPVSLGIKHPSEAYDQIFITVRELWFCWCGTLSMTSGRVSSLQLLQALASAVILGSESRGICNHILLSQIRDFPFRRLLPLAGLWWRYSTPPPHGNHSRMNRTISFIISRRTEYMSPCLTVPLLFCLYHENVC
jgi:hypothetical protein